MVGKVTSQGGTMKNFALPGIGGGPLAAMTRLKKPPKVVQKSSVA